MQSLDFEKDIKRRNIEDPKGQRSKAKDEIRQIHLIINLKDQNHSKIAIKKDFCRQTTNLQKDNQYNKRPTHKIMSINFDAL